MPRLTLYPVFDSYLLAAVVALLLLGLMWLGLSRTKATGWRRRLLIAPRAIVIVLVILAMLRPTLVYTQTKKQAATLVVLADDSRSMSVPDAVGNKTRWEALRNAVSDAAPALAKLQQDFELKAYTFDGEAHAAAVEEGKIALPEKPEGQQTAIGAALEDVVLRREAGKRLLGVVLLSDGAQRAVAPHDLPPQTAAVRLKYLGHPLYTLPFGQSRGLGEAQDVSVKDLIVNPMVFVKNELTTQGQIRVDGYVNRDIPVRLLFETSPGKMETVAEETLKATADGQVLPIKLSYIPEVPGEYKLTLEAVEQTGELVTTNNRLSTFVNVLKGGLNVLYLEGSWRWEMKYLRRALDASPDIHVDFERADPHEGKLAGLAERLLPGKYEVVILGDIDSSVFQEDDLSRLAECVNRGTGLLMLGGLHSFGPGGFGETPWGKVRPVGMDRLERQTLDAPLRADLHVPGLLKMQPTAIGLQHFALMLAGNRQQNEDAWAKLPALDGANKFHNLAAGAVVLADAGEKVPMLVSQDYGDGRVMAFAGDTTWRWQMHGFESAHKRFWRQIILWLAHKDQLQEGSVWVRLLQRRFAPSQRVEFSVGAKSPSGEAVADAKFEAEIVLPDETRRPLPLVRQEEQMVGSFRDTQIAGDYAIEVKATRNGEPLGNARARFLVFQQDMELDNASADAATLESLAAMTGGESLAPEQLPALIERLAADTKHLEVQQETKKTFWDTWEFFLTVVGLLGLEWYLRKRWGLV